jgi:hypothetical protein
MPLKLKVPKPKKATKKVVEVMERMQKNQYYSNLIREKDKDYNTKLELYRLEGLKNIPLYSARIAELKKQIKK